MSAAVLALVSSLAAECDANAGEGDCVWAGAIHSSERLINNAKLNWNQIPLPVPLGTYMSPWMAVQPGALNTLSVTDNANNPVLPLQTITLDTPGEFALVMYEEDQAYSFQKVELPQWTAYKNRVQVHVFNFGTSDPVDIIVNANAAVTVAGRSAATIESNIPASGVVAVSMQHASGTQRQTFVLTGVDLKEIFAITTTPAAALPSGRTVSLQLLGRSFLNQRLVDENPPVAEAGDALPESPTVACLRSVEGCEAVAGGEATECAAACAPCGTADTCDSLLEQTEYGVRAQGGLAGGWGRIKAACCATEPAATNLGDTPIPLTPAPPTPQPPTPVPSTQPPLTPRPAGTSSSARLELSALAALMCTAFVLL